MNNRDLSDELLCELRDYSFLDKKIEMCGVIAKIKDSLKFISSKNLSDSPRHFFELDPRLIVEYDVRYIFQLELRMENERYFRAHPEINGLL